MKLKYNDVVVLKDSGEMGVIIISDSKYSLLEIAAEYSCYKIEVYPEALEKTSNLVKIGVL